MINQLLRCVPVDKQQIWTKPGTVASARSVNDACIRVDPELKAGGRMNLAVARRDTVEPLSEVGDQLGVDLLIGVSAGRQVEEVG